MLFSIKQFNKEIAALKQSADSGGKLHPLRREQIKQAVLTAIKTRPSLAGQALRRQERNVRVVRYAVSILAGLSLVGGTAFAASGGAKPGDIRYPVKKA